MNRMNRRYRRHRESLKDPERPSTSEQRSQPSSTKKPLRLLPPSIEKNWTADEVWALMRHTERKWPGNQFTDKPEYWKNLAALIQGSTAENLRNIHMAILEYQDQIVLWNLDDLQKLIASFHEIIHEPLDTPKWWGEIALNFPSKTALDCRLAYNTFCQSKTSENSSDVQPQPSVSGTKKTDAASTSSQRTSVTVPKRTTMFSVDASSQRTSVLPLQNWTLEDYMSLMTILTKNLHVDTDDAGAMESIALQMVGKTAEEVRHLILKWRPQLLAALEKADRIVASSFGKKGPGTSHS